MVNCILWCFLDNTVLTLGRLKHANELITTKVLYQMTIGHIILWNTRYNNVGNNANCKLILLLAVMNLEDTFVLVAVIVAVLPAISE